MLSKFFAESRLTLALAVPIMAGQVSQMLMGIADSAMVGRLGVTPLAASAFANNVAMVPLVFGMGILTCLSVRVAQSHGAGDHEESGEVLRHTLILATLMGAMLTWLVWFLSLHLDRFGQSPEVAQEARDFLVLIGWSIVPAILAMGLKQFCEALGDAWPPTLILLAAVPLNVALNWVFIYGNLGSPALGLSGAGWGTLLSRIASLIALTIYLARAKKLRDSLPVVWRQPLQRARFISLLTIGIPASLQLLLEVGAFSLGAILIGRLGAQALAAHQIALSCVATSFMLPLGLSIATTIRIGQVVGSGELERVRTIGFASFGLSLSVMLVTATIFWLEGFKIASAFVNDPAVAHLATRLIFVAAIFQLADGLQVVSAGALRGLSDATFPMIICFLAYWAMGLPLGYYATFNLGWGPVGIWCGFALGLFLLALVLVWRFTMKSRLEALSKTKFSQEPILSAH